MSAAVPFSGALMEQTIPREEATKVTRELQLTSIEVSFSWILLPWLMAS